jgi:hypothetical protein
VNDASAWPLLLLLPCLAVGFYLITYRGSPRDFGIAVAVGALFAFGAFAAQWWAVGVQREAYIHDAAYHESNAALWHELYLKRVRIEARIKALDEAHQGNGPSANLIRDEPRLEGEKKAPPSDP